MSGPATPIALRRVPCEHCGSTRTIRWAYQGGRVLCVDLTACGRRAQAKQAKELAPNI
jgi:hypothetical protein